MVRALVASSRDADADSARACTVMQLRQAGKVLSLSGMSPVHGRCVRRFYVPAPCPVPYLAAQVDTDTLGSIVTRGARRENSLALSRFLSRRKIRMPRFLPLDTDSCVTERVVSGGCALVVYFQRHSLRISGILEFLSSVDSLTTRHEKHLEMN